MFFPIFVLCCLGISVRLTFKIISKSIKLRYI